MVDRLRKRRDFLAAARAERAGVSAFLMQGRDRGDQGDVRIGLTVTKKTGNSVVRNRIRRRLREAVRQVLPDAGKPGYDYVLVAREAALRMPFGGLVQDLERAVRKLHELGRAQPGRSQTARPRGPKRTSTQQPKNDPSRDPQSHDHQAHSPDPKAKPADGGHPA